MRRRRTIIYLFSGIILVLAGVRFVLLDRLNLQSLDLYSLQTQIKDLNRENMLLYDEILEREALTTIASQAAQEGFQKTQYYFLGQNGN